MRQTTPRTRPAARASPGEVLMDLGDDDRIEHTRHRVAVDRERDVADVRVQSKDVDRSLYRPRDVRRQSIEEEVARDADAQTRGRWVRRRLHRVRGWHCRRIAHVVTRCGWVDQHHIGDRARQQPGVIEGRCGAEQAGSTDPSERRLEADAAAERRWNADATARVAPGGRRGKSGGDCGRRSAAGSTRHARAIPGIARRAEERIDRRHATAELVCVALAQQDRAGRRQPRDDRRILRRHILLVEP